MAPLNRAARPRRSRRRDVEKGPERHCEQARPKPSKVPHPLAAVYPPPALKLASVEAGPSYPIRPRRATPQLEPARRPPPRCPQPPRNPRRYAHRQRENPFVRNPDSAARRPGNRRNNIPDRFKVKFASTLHAEGVPILQYDPVTVSPQHLHAVLSLIIVDVELAVLFTFFAFLRALHHDGRLNRIVLNEAHLLLTASHYRENLGSLGVLRRVKCSFVCITATLFPSAELELKQLLLFTSLETLRASSDRPNIEYCI